MKDKWDFQITSEIISIGYRVMLEMSLSILTLQCALRNQSLSFNDLTINSEMLIELGIIKILFTLTPSV